MQRKQFPFVPRGCLLEAVTMYKSQGRTYDHVAIQLDRKLRRNELYVALNRCTKLNGLYLTGFFTPPSPPSVNDKVLTEMQKLFSKQIVLSCLFTSMISTQMTIIYPNLESIKKSALDWLAKLYEVESAYSFVAAETCTLPAADICIDGYNVLLRMYNDMHMALWYIWSKASLPMCYTRMPVKLSEKHYA